MILAELENWERCRTAILYYENDSICLYSYPSDEYLDMKMVWVVNTKKRELNINSEAMEKGLQIHLDEEYCSEKGYIKDFEDVEEWELQWGLEQNSIAVYFKKEIIAILPEWSQLGEFQGYSIGAKRTSIFAWPLKKDNVLIQKFLDEKLFLVSWSESSFGLRQETLLTFYKNLYKGDFKYAATNLNKWPPIGIHFSKSAEIEFIATVGMSQLPMPRPYSTVENDEKSKRIEIALAFRPISNSSILAEYLAGQISYPWHYGIPFNHGDTIPCSQLQELGSNSSYYLFVEFSDFIPKVLIPSFDDGSVRLLYMIPIYESEKQFIIEHSSESLIKIIEKSEVDPYNIYRDAVV